MHIHTYIHVHRYTYMVWPPFILVQVLSVFDYAFVFRSRTCVRNMETCLKVVAECRCRGYRKFAVYLMLYAFCNT